MICLCTYNLYVSFSDFKDKHEATTQTERIHTNLLKLTSEIEDKTPAHVNSELFGENADKFMNLREFRNYVSLELINLEKTAPVQLPAVLARHVTIIISPLRSLIMDQVNKLTLLNIPVVHLTTNNKQGTVNKLKSGRLKMVYVTPEKLFSGFFTELLKLSDQVERFVIDEANCIVDWGHIFRKSFMRLNELKPNFPHVPITALAATATILTRDHIVSNLNLTSSCKKFIGNFDRTNLQYSIVATSCFI